MKILTTIAIVLLLAGCANMLAPDFDSNEYGQIVELQTHAMFLETECGTPKSYANLNQMDWKAMSLLTYASHIPHNNEITEMIRIIDEDITQMMDRYRSGMSKAYCQLKAKQLQIKLDQILDSVGAL